VADKCGALGAGKPKTWLSDLEVLEETLDLLSTPGALEQIRKAEADIAAGRADDADDVRRLLAERAEREQRG
jgi:antitoxin YefM